MAFPIFVAKISYLRQMVVLLAGFILGAGVYLVLSRPQALWLLIGLEMMLNASGIILVYTGSPEALALLLLLLFFALVEAAVALFLFTGWKKHTGTFSLETLLSDSP
jgi:NADH:ubiquinone oxidoreductase subunit K